MTPKTPATEITPQLALEIAGEEAICRQAYRDPLGKVWTWSIGLTSATGHVVERYIGKPQSLEHCLRVYAWALDNYADAVRKVFAGVPLTAEQFAGFVSFQWNTGRITSAKWVEPFKAGNWKEAERIFKGYNTAGGKVVQVLKDRRAREADLIFRGKWSNTRGTVTEYGVTPKGTIDWHSGRKVNIADTLRLVLSGHVPEADKVIFEAPPVAQGSTVGIAVAGTGGSALLAVDPLARGVDMLTSQQSELTSGDYARIGVAVLVIVVTVWLAIRQSKGAVA